MGCVFGEGYLNEAGPSGGWCESVWGWAGGWGARSDRLARGGGQRALPLPLPDSPPSHPPLSAALPHRLARGGGQRAAARRPAVHAGGGARDHGVSAHLDALPAGAEPRGHAQGEGPHPRPPSRPSLPSRPTLPSHTRTHAHKHPHRPRRRLTRCWARGTPPGVWSSTGACGTPSAAWRRACASTPTPPCCCAARACQIHCQAGGWDGWVEGPAAAMLLCSRAPLPSAGPDWALPRPLLRPSQPSCPQAPNRPPHPAPPHTQAATACLRGRT